MTHYATWLADELRRWGCRVVEVDGWKSRGRPASVGRFAPRGVLIHHTAGPASGNAPSLNVVRAGRADLPGPLAQVLIARDGTCYVVAAGRSNHAGTGRWGPVPTDSGNIFLIGFECENTGVGEPWGTSQLRAMERASAAVLHHTGESPGEWLLGHKEYAPTRKIDPAGVSMTAFRHRVAELLAAGPTPTPEPTPSPAPTPTPGPTPRRRKVSLKRLKRAARLDPVRRQGKGTAGCRRHVGRYEAALAAAGFLEQRFVDGSFGSKTIAATAALQASYGYTGADADGMPGPSSLRRLCAQHNLKDVA